VKTGRKIATVAGTLGLGLAGMLIAGAGPASADTIGGGGGDQDICGVQLCLYYYNDDEGAMWYSDAPQWNDLAGQTFGYGPTSSGGEGVNAPVKNNAQSAANGGNYGVYIYVNSAAYGWGAYDYLPSGDIGNLATTWNNEASYSIYYNG
jgi:hypothetical protein